MIDNITNIIESNFMLAPLFSLVAGFLMAFTPCSLTSIPLVIGYVSGSEVNTKRSFILSLIFSLGMALTFTSLGVVAVLIGSFVNFSSDIFLVVMGLLLILMFLQMIEIINIMPTFYFATKNKKRGSVGAFITGILAGFFSSPCSTPVLILILTIVSTGGNLAYGILLLFMYSLGHSALTIFAGTSTGFVKKMSRSSKYGIFSEIVKYTFALIILLFGFYLFYLGV